MVFRRNASGLPRDAIFPLDGSQASTKILFFSLELGRKCANMWEYLHSEFIAWAKELLRFLANADTCRRAREDDRAGR